MLTKLCKLTGGQRLDSSWADNFVLGHLLKCMVRCMWISFVYFAKYKHQINTFFVWWNCGIIALYYIILHEMEGIEVGKWVCLKLQFRSFQSKLMWVKRSLFLFYQDKEASCRAHPCHLENNWLLIEWHTSQVWFLAPYFQLYRVNWVREGSRYPGWQKLCGGTKGPRQKIWTRAKIFSPNIRYFVAD